ncbi:MAG: hypothetical protein LBH05_08995 [Deferribacteraceae bacterium]|jgi:hypothetical protein|nr:hypothetical protein [Deferribacteraceae bacterium]
MSCRTGILYTFGITFKFIFYCLFVAVLALSASEANAQRYTGSDDSITIDDDYPFFDPDDAPLVLPKGETFEEGPTIENVIEGVGTVISSLSPVYFSQDKKDKVMRYAILGEKVTIIANNDEWFSVRMYNGKEGFMEKSSIRTAKVFTDETVTPNQINKRLNVELYTLIEKFNDTLRESVYARKFQIIPKLKILANAQKGKSITVTLEYSAVDINGTSIPSMQTNALGAEMRYFIEVFFIKMLTVGADEYRVLIRKPVFSQTGQALNTLGEYADITVKHGDVPLDEIKRQRGKILKVAICSMPAEKLFTGFPY